MSIFDIEKKAMVLDREAVLSLVSIERRLRQASEQLLSKRYKDGEVDRVALDIFSDTIDHLKEDFEES